MSDLPSLPTQGRLAGIDFGTVRIGIAITDPDRILASPLTTYRRRSKDQDADFFTSLTNNEAVAGFVVGLPVHMSGDESQKSREARQFGQWLAEVTGKPVAFYDERFSTLDATEMLLAQGLKGKKAAERKDMLAAQSILERFLRSAPAEARKDRS